MDYELMMNGTVKIGQKAPEFEANTTIGKIKLSDYNDKWLVLFSYSGDFTPVSTTEIMAFSAAFPYFKRINTSLLGLSLDSNPSHFAWIREIFYMTNNIVPFPLIADGNGEIARKYGMIASDISNTVTVRNVFIIDDKQTVKAIFVYPLNVGRYIPEILRIVQALQMAENLNCMIPANWNQYQDEIKPILRKIE